MSGALSPSYRGAGQAAAVLTGRTTWNGGGRRARWRTQRMVKHFAGGAVGFGR